MSILEIIATILELGAPLLLPLLLPLALILVAYFFWDRWELFAKLCAVVGVSFLTIVVILLVCLQFVSSSVTLQASIIEDGEIQNSESIRTNEKWEWSVINREGKPIPVEISASFLFGGITVRDKAYVVQASNIAERILQIQLDRNTPESLRVLTQTYNTSSPIVQGIVPIDELNIPKNVRDKISSPGEHNPIAVAQTNKITEEDECTGVYENTAAPVKRHFEGIEVCVTQWLSDDDNFLVGADIQVRHNGSDNSVDDHAVQRESPYWHDNLKVSVAILAFDPRPDCAFIVFALMKYQ